MDNFEPKPIGLTPLEKCQYFDFLRFLFFYNLVRRFFVLEYHKIKNLFMLSVRISSYGCTREVWRARKMRKSCTRR